MTIARYNSSCFGGLLVALWLTTLLISCSNKRNRINPRSCLTEQIKWISVEVPDGWSPYDAIFNNNGELVLSAYNSEYLVVVNNSNIATIKQVHDNNGKIGIFGIETTTHGETIALIRREDNKSREIAFLSNDNEHITQNFIQVSGQRDILDINIAKSSNDMLIIERHTLQEAGNGQIINIPGTFSQIAFDDRNGDYWLSIKVYNDRWNADEDYLFNVTGDLSTELTSITAKGEFAGINSDSELITYGVSDIITNGCNVNCFINFYQLPEAILTRTISTQTIEFIRVLGNKVILVTPIGNNANAIGIIDENEIDIIGSAHLVQ